MTGWLRRKARERSNNYVASYWENMDTSAQVKINRAIDQWFDEGAPEGRLRAKLAGLAAEKDAPGGAK